MRSVFLATVAAFAFAAQAAHANAVYDWVNTSGSLSASFTVTDPAVESGTMNFFVTYDGGGNAFCFPGQCGNFADLVSLNGSDGGRSFSLAIAPQLMNFSIQFLSNGLLNGGMAAFSEGAGFRMNGNGTNWSGFFAGDTGSCAQSPCSVDGYWQLRSAPTNSGVPEPISAFMLAAGLTTLPLLRRRKTK